MSIYFFKVIYCRQSFGYPLSGNAKVMSIYQLQSSMLAMNPKFQLMFQLQVIIVVFIRAYKPQSNRANESSSYALTTTSNLISVLYSLLSYYSHFSFIVCHYYTTTSSPIPVFCSLLPEEAQKAKYCNHSVLLRRKGGICHPLKS